MLIQSNESNKYRNKYELYFNRNEENFIRSNVMIKNKYYKTKFSADILS